MSEQSNTTVAAEAAIAAVLAETLLQGTLHRLTKDLAESAMGQLFPGHLCRSGLLLHAAGKPDEQHHQCEASRRCFRGNAQ